MASSTPRLSETEYQKWARNLVGKDWEIFWQEDEDRNEDDPMEIEAPETKASIDINATATASGQETAEEKKATSASDGIVEIEMKAVDANVQTIESSMEKDTSVGMKQPTETTNKNDGTIQVDGKENEGKDEGDEDTNSDDEGSIIDDWYDGNVLEIIDDENGPVGKNGWKFKILFLGDEEVYEVFLEPRKVRPSARGWVQRSIALLNPPTTAAGENNNSEEETSLPSDTSTLDDQTHMQQLKAKMIDSSNQLDGVIPNVDGTNSNSETLSVPSYSNFRRIQMLRFQLESQIFLRNKLSKIENHAGKELFTEGVRNPTENYVNYLVQCCKDLAQACSWYCNSWKLLLFYFGNSSTSIGNGHLLNGNDSKDKNTAKNGEEIRGQPTDLGSLTFERLVKEYLEFGKDTIVNAAMIDINASGASNKRRQAIVPDLALQNNNRRTKRRRKTSSNAGGAEEESNEKNTKLLTAASEFETEILSKDHTDRFVNTVAENIHHRHISILGSMLKSLSHLIVDPLVLWKNQARSILRMKNEGNDPYNSMIDRTNTKDVDEAKISSSDSEVEELEVFFSDEQIEGCLSAIRNNSVLSKFNLFDDIHKLHAKLDSIQKNEATVLALLNELASITSLSPEESYKNQSQDKVLYGLSSALHEMDSPESTLYNIDPLSTKKSSFVISRDDISKAIELRSWFVDVQHAQLIRERHSFLQRLLSKIEPINTLPNPNEIPSLAKLPQVFQRRETLTQSLLEFQTKIQNSAEIIQKRENRFLAALSSVDFSKRSDLTTHLDFSQSMLAESRELPVIFPIEEKIAAQIDFIQWYKQAEEIFGSKSPEGEVSLPFADLETLHGDLKTILQGLSSSRLSLVNGVAPNSKIDDEIRGFLLSDLFSNCKQTTNEVTTLYSSSSSWKKRAEVIITCLQMHGNINAGEAIMAQKLPSMVDIKRVTDLTTEYPSLRIEMSSYFGKLQRIQSEAYDWSQNLYNTMMDDNISFSHALSFVQKEKDQRPKGIIIFPTRTVADSTVDFLSWYENIKSVAEVVSKEVQRLSVEDDQQRLAAAYSTLMIEKLYPMLADGSDALEIYFSTYKVQNELPGKFLPNSDKCLQILDKLFRIRKTSRAPSREKVTSNDLISSLFSRMASKEIKEGFPLQFMTWVQWHLLVADFVSQDENENGNDRGSRGTKTRSLLQANKLNGDNPFLLDDLDFSNATNTKILIKARTKELVEFEKLIEEAQDAEASIKKSLSTSKELFRGSLLEKDERIKEHLTTLRTMSSILKARSLGEGGLSLNGAFDNPLERHMKCFTWLVRTLQYPVLHEGEAAFSSTSEGSGIESPKIPFNALVSIHERMPIEISEFGDHILCILRVRELYKAAKKWQDEVSRTTLISNRGNKRRGKTSDNVVEEENDAKLCMRKMEMLAEDHILSKVDMPRHKAVKAMVDAKREFEIQLENFLSQDFDGNQDNAPLPKGDSLVGQNGQFILYRLTGSSLFTMMQTSIQSLGLIGDNVFAETTGKATFDWMRSAVTWIEELVDAVEAQSKLTDSSEKLLVIPLKDAMRLCKSGDTIFLQTTNKDVTKTLSNHGIYVSVNSIKKRLNVRLKKDGAHHSVGGIIIRWCPILFDALRADVVELEKWESGLNKVVDNFSAFAARASSSIAGEANLFQWYCYFMDIQTALEEGQNTLVVSPKKETIDYFTKILGTIRVHLDENCSSDMIQEFSKRRFSNSASLYTDRYELLETLLYRREISTDKDMEEPSAAPHETKQSLRDVCRSNLENALLRAAWVLNLEAEGISDAEDLCALKAWDIELEMFELFRDESTNSISHDYKAKAQSLKNILENTSNLSLCLEVLTDDTKPNSLVKMTADQVVSRFKLEREEGKQAALRGKSLRLAASARTTRDMQSKPLKSIIKSRPRFSTTRKDSPTNKLPNNDSIEYDSDLNADGAPTMDSDEEKSVRKESSSETQIEISSTLASNKRKRWDSDVPRSTPPPPPPSLARSFDTFQQNDKNPLVGSESRISSASGGNSFHMELQGQSKYAFSAVFYQQDTSPTTVGRFMPESLIQKGRSKTDDFERFASEKLKGGRWQATCLRMATATASDRDASVYKAFYKDFEAKERIAMFKLRDDSFGGKLFLVTPKFHHVARRIRGISFANKNSTYAVVLTKKEDSAKWN